MNDLIPDFEFLAFFCAGISLAIGGFLYSIQKSLRKQLSGLHEALVQESKTRKQIEEDFRALLRCSKNMGQRLRDYSPEEERLVTTPLNFSFDPQELETGDKVHELVERGLSVDEVASICGLTRGEVDFLSRFFDHDVKPQAMIAAG
ncbi:MAG: hypothetical protein AAF387_19865 [Pseudomonadota bacterium]